METHNGTAGLCGAWQLSVSTKTEGDGFKTFGNYIDESYDLEQDPDKRINKIVSLCKDLKTKNWQDIYCRRKH